MPEIQTTTKPQWIDFSRLRKKPNKQWNPPPQKKAKQKPTPQKTLNPQIQNFSPVWSW